MFDFINSETTGYPATYSVLSVSGGGLLGVIPAAMLTRYETLGRAAYGENYRLCQSFDLAGGTSTGAVIATAVALGCSAKDIADFYLDAAPRTMKRRWTSIPFIHDRYDADLVTAQYAARTKGARLERSALQCDLAITVKDIARGRPVLFTTMPSNETTLLGATLRQDALPLDQLLRASTAAPFLFGPTALTLADGSTMPVVDGGLSPFNDPSLLLAELALRSRTGKVHLSAFGTGASRPRYNSANGPGGAASLTRALRALLGTIKDCEDLAAALLGAMERSRDGFSCRRHDLGLDAQTLRDLGFDLSPAELRAVRRFDDCGGKHTLFDAALAHAEATIDAPLPLARQHAAAKV